MMKSVQVFAFLYLVSSQLHFVDRDARTVTSIIRFEETVPTVVRRRPIWFHPNMVSVSVTRSRVNTWERAE